MEDMEPEEKEPKEAEEAWGPGGASLGAPGGAPGGVHGGAHTGFGSGYLQTPPDSHSGPGPDYFVVKFSFKDG